METRWPVAITACGNASVATVAWGRGTERFVTAIVKATFAFVPSGAMAEIAPEPVHAREQEGAPGTGLRAADDLAPYLAETDVCLTGHAHAARVRLAILRDTAVLLDKVVDCEPPRGAGGAPGSAPILGMGPISKQWPARRRLLGHVDPRHLEGLVFEIPDPFDWRYYQAASSDMRAAPLRGDEWILVEGAHPTLPRLMTQLPGARAQAWLSGPSVGAAAAAPVDLVLDTIRIDADRRRCSLTWRRHFPVRGPLGGVLIAAGVALPGRPIAWPARAAELEEDEDSLAGTLQIEEADFVDEPAPGDDPLAGTLGLGEGTLAELAARPATPFRKGISSPLAAPSQPPTRPANDDPLGGTLGLNEVFAASLAARPVTPFANEVAPTPSVEAEDPLAGTMGLTEGTLVELAARPATPFRADISSSLALSSSPVIKMPRAPEEDALGGTMNLDPAAAAAATARPAIPFRAIHLPGKDTILSPGSPQLDVPFPKGLGAAFLAAMAALENRAR